MAGSCELEKEMLCLCRQDHIFSPLSGYHWLFLSSFHVTVTIIGCTRFTTKVFPDVGKELRDALVGNQGRGLGCSVYQGLRHVLFYFVKKQFCTLVHNISYIRLPDSPNLSQSEFSPLELLFFWGVYPTFTDPYGGFRCVAPGLLISAIRKHRASLEAAHLRAESEDVWAPGHVSTVWLKIINPPNWMVE